MKEKEEESQPSEKMNAIVREREVRVKVIRRWCDGEYNADDVPARVVVEEQR